VVPQKPTHKKRLAKCGKKLLKNSKTIILM
jgi:hypothetical protein